MAINLKGEDKNPYLRANSLDELLEWHDADFVRCAFVTILGRQPDAPGETHYVGRLRAGHSRLAILQDLRRSDEATCHDPGIAGLDRALRFAAMQRIPILGAIFRGLSKHRDGDSQVDRNHRALLNAAAANQASIHSLATQVRSLEWLLHGYLTPPRSASASGSGIGAHSVAELPSFETQVRAELAHVAVVNPLVRHFAVKVH